MQTAHKTWNCCPRRAQPGSASSAARSRKSASSPCVSGWSAPAVTNAPNSPNAGNYIVTVTCETLNTIYTGTANFTIAKKPIDLDVTLDCGKGFVYDGTAKEPGVTVNFKDTTNAPAHE